MTKANVKRIKKTVTECDTLMIKLLLECWNNPAPHFGGGMPHRYDGNSRLCGYCNRPKDWKQVNPGVVASDIVYGDGS